MASRCFARGNLRPRPAQRDVERPQVAGERDAGGRTPGVARRTPTPRDSTTRVLSIPSACFPGCPAFFDSPEPQQQAEPPPDPELALDAPLDSKVFLRAVVDQKNPVVGEQVTLTVYVYARQTALELTDLHEPSIPDFYRRDLLSPQNQPEPRPVSIGGVIWRAQPIYKAALFPLKSGEIEIGAMQSTVIGRGSGLNAARASQPIKLHVSEPPSKGRPVGYQMGDVGSYTLTVTVDPRKSEVGGAVAVTLSWSE